MSGKGFIRGLIADSVGVLAIFGILLAFLAVTTDANLQEITKGALRAIKLIGL